MCARVGESPLLLPKALLNATRGPSLVASKRHVGSEGNKLDLAGMAESVLAACASAVKERSAARGGAPPEDWAWAGK